MIYVNDDPLKELSLSAQGDVQYTLFPYKDNVFINNLSHINHDVSITGTDETFSHGFRQTVKILKLDNIVFLKAFCSKLNIMSFLMDGVSLLMIFGFMCY